MILPGVVKAGHYINQRNLKMQFNVMIKLFQYAQNQQDQDQKLIYYLNKGTKMKQNNFILLHQKKDQMRKIIFRDSYPNYETQLYHKFFTSSIQIIHFIQLCLFFLCQFSSILIFHSQKQS
ncbi:unnamed protein product [Paramecium sonneborni]|uniref:Transmembrane protein n=1 Tax=Paramecium sonneborni TaxID=65129 RepID=A0A8S1RSU3_9CILI|nr:unnamed protein product [Paramecium sonneborni]